MANFKERITDFGCGDPLTITRDIAEEGITQSLTRAYLTIKRELTDNDEDATVALAVTTTATTIGQLVATGAGTGRVTFHLSEADTPLLMQPHWIEIRVVTTDDKSYVTSFGTIRGHRTVKSLV